MVRLHVGLEGADALWTDLAGAIDFAARSADLISKQPSEQRRRNDDQETHIWRPRMSALAAATRPLADTTLKLVEVITSPERTETLKEIVKTFEDANPGVKVEIISLPWGQAFEKFATMVSAGETPDVVEMPDRWQALYAKNGMLENLEPYLAKWEHTEDLNDRALQIGRYVENTAYVLPYGFYLRAMFYNKKLFKEAGVADPPKTLDEFTEAAKKVSALPGKYGYCLRGGPGGLNGWVMFGATTNGDNDLLQGRRHLDLRRPGLGQGRHLPRRPLQERLRAEGQRQLGLQRDRRRLLFRHLRHARPGPRRADRRRRAHEAGGLRRRAVAEGPGRQGLPDHRLCRLVDVLQQRATRTWPGS